MAILTTLNRDDIDRLLDKYPALPRAPFSFRGIEAGSVNTFYRIQHRNSASYFLRIDEVGDRARLLNELRIFANLNRHRDKLTCGFNFPLMTKSGSHYLPFRRKFALLFPAIPGRSRFGAALTPAHLKVVGAKLAEWHHLPAERRIRPHRFDLAGQRRVFRDIRAVLMKRNPPLYDFIHAKFRELVARAPAHEKTALIHADLFPDNLLWTGKRLNGILDFDSAGIGPPLFDIGVCLHALCHDEKKFHHANARALLAGYQTVHKLTTTDWKHLPYYLELSALRFLLTRLRDFEYPAKGKRLGFYKDYRVYERRFGEIGNWGIAFPRRIVLQYVKRRNQ